MPEQWRRYDEGATQAFDSGDEETYRANLDVLARIERSLEPVRYLRSGQGILHREAVRLFREAASLGDPEAMWNLGWRYELGQGIGAASTLSSSGDERRR